MKNSIPFPVVFFGIALVATAAYFVTKKQAVKQKGPAPRARTAIKTSKNYDDKLVAFQYPSSFKVRSETRDKPNMRFWIAEYPDNTDVAKWAEFSIDRYPDRKESRSLEAIYKSKTWDARYIHPPKTVLLDGGKCLTYQLDYSLDDNRVDTDGRTRTVKACTRVENQAHCYADDGRFFEIHAFSGAYCDRQKPDPGTQKKIKDYNAFLRSLKFKPLS